MNPLVVIKVNITFYDLHDFKVICKALIVEADFSVPLVL